MTTSSEAKSIPTDQERAVIQGSPDTDTTMVSEPTPETKNSITENGATMINSATGTTSVSKENNIPPPTSGSIVTGAQASGTALQEHGMQHKGEINNESGRINAPPNGNSEQTLRQGAPPQYKSRSWHVDPQADVEPRRLVIQEIVNLLESCKPKAFAKREEKLVDLARRLEVALYKQSKTIDEYMDSTTLRYRVRELAKASTAQQQQQEDLKKQQQQRQGTSGVPATGGLGTSASTNGVSEVEQRQQILKQRQQRLLLLKHASRCQSVDGTCKVTPHCAPMKRLWTHIPNCKDTRCQVAHCVSSRYVLSHFHKCKDEECPVCKPVRIISRSSAASQQVRRPNSLRANGRTTNTPIIDPRNARRCISGTGPSLPLSLSRNRVEKHISSLRVERLQMAVTPLLRKLIEHKQNKGVFNEPVDPVALNIPDYPKIIKDPMDLGTIRKRLDACHYRSLDHFKDDIFLVFRNAFTFNPPENDIHVRAQNLLKLAEAEIPRIKNKLDRDGRKRGEDCPLCFQQKCETCPLCERGCIPFEPKVLFCSGPCTQRIARNSVYYTGVGNNYCWCSDCHDKVRGPNLTVNNQVFSKQELIKKKNNELYGEPWVSCDLCERWMHQVCALFNSRKNSPDSTQQYICPLCLIQESRLGEAERRENPPEKVKDEKKDDEGEKKMTTTSENGNSSTEKTEQEKVATTKPPEGAVISSEPAGSTNVTVANNTDANGSKQESSSNDTATAVTTGAVTNSTTTLKAEEGNKELVTKGKYKHLVLPAGKPVPGAQALPETRLSVFLQMWLRDKIQNWQETNRKDPKRADEDLGPSPEELHVRVMSNFDENCKVKPFVKSLLPDYPDAFPFRSRCILLFQTLDGVDVLFFAMFVQEYGSDCPEPNRRKLYIAYLDSVYYFRPRRLRTTIYHELLLAYLEYSRRNGFTSAYIWACPPPNKRDDYIIHCHPEDQRVQTADRLRKWYHEMIRQGSNYRVCLGSCALFEEHFESIARPSSKKKNSKSSKNKKKTKSKTKSNKKGKKGTSRPAVTVGSATRSAATLSVGNIPTASPPPGPSDKANPATDIVADDGSNTNGPTGLDDEDHLLTDLPDIDQGDDDDDDEDDDQTTKADDKEGTGSVDDANKPPSIFVTPGNGLMAGDDRMLAADIDRRKVLKLARNGKIPYFEGDYWPQEAEELAKERLKKKKKELEKSGKAAGDDNQPLAIRKRRRNGDPASDENDPNPDAVDAPANPAVSSDHLDMTEEEKEEAQKQLIQRLSEQLDAMKDDFLVVKLAHECMRCGMFLIRGRWECRHPDCRGNSGFNKPCPFALCNNCYILEKQRPIEQQHGNGCIAPGQAGEPIDVKLEAVKEAGEDQVKIDVNAELKKKEAEKLEKERKEKEGKRSEDTSAPTATPKEEQASNSASSTAQPDSKNADTTEGVTAPASVNTASSSGENAERMDVDGNNEPKKRPAGDELTMTEQSDAKRARVEKGQEETSSTSKNDSSPPTENTSTTSPTMKEEKAPISTLNSSSKSPTESTSKPENGESTEESKTSNPSTSAGASSDKEKPEKSKVKTEAELKAEVEAKRVAEEEKRKKEAEEEAAKLKILVAEWSKQDIKCTRLQTKDSDDHTLYYVDESLPVNTPDHDKILKNQLLETRHAFLSLCTTNRYQFDQLRRAKHSTMMVLYHLHNPDAPAHLYTCCECHTDILEGKRFHCDICNGGDYDICARCNRGRPHKHTLTPFTVTRGVNAETSEAQRMQRVTEMRRARKHSLTLFLQALVHSSTCTDPLCKEAPCKKMKDLLQHRMVCKVRVRGGCEVCRRVLCLVQMHARNCKTENCRVPHCEDLKQHIKSQLNARRRSQVGMTTRPRQSSLMSGRRKSLTQSPALPSGQPMKATLVEGSGGTRLKIRPAISKPKVNPVANGMVPAIPSTTQQNGTAVGTRGARGTRGPRN